MTSPEYRAAPGKEDRHGEMTGAITFNMMMLMVPLTVWCVFIGPGWVGITWTLIVGVVLASLGFTVTFPLSRRLWARFSEWSDQI